MLELKKVYDCIEVGDKGVYLNGKFHPAKVGKHAIWVPNLEMKIPWTYHGRIESFRDWDKGRNRDRLLYGRFNSFPGFHPSTIVSLINEGLLFSLLAERQMAPPIGGYGYIKKSLSCFVFGRVFGDSDGLYGLLIRDARKLPPGKWSFDRFRREFLDTGKIRASDGAIGDLQKSDNIVNGYLVDVRRTLWDMMQVGEGLLENKALDIWNSIRYRDGDLPERIERLTQFPYGKRKSNYQTYPLNGKWMQGSRDTLKRLDYMKVPAIMNGLNVLDLGCNVGAICCECYRRGAAKVLGIDNEKDYIYCAMDLSKSNGHHIDYSVVNLQNAERVIEMVGEYFVWKPVDILFALSIYKHIGGVLWDILGSGFPWKRCYVESHNAPDGLETGHVKEMIRGMKGLKNVEITYIGTLTDRSPRCIWSLQKH